MFLTIQNQIVRDDIYYDLIPFANFKSNYFLLLHKLTMPVKPGQAQDLRNKSIVRLMLLTIMPATLFSFSVGFTITANLTAAAICLAGVALSHLVVAIYDFSLKKFKENYHSSEIKKKPKFETFNKLPIEFKTDLEFILKVADQNRDNVLYIFPFKILGDPIFLHLLSKKKINPFSRNLFGQIQGLTNKFYYDSLKQGDQPQIVSITGPTPQDIWSKLPTEMVKEIFKWLPVSSTLKFSMTGKKVKLMSEPLLKEKINVFFTNEVHQIIKGIKIYLYAIDKHNPTDLDEKFIVDLREYFAQVADGKLDIESYDASDWVKRDSDALIIKDLKSMMDSKFEVFSPQVVTYSRLVSLNRIETIKTNILFTLNKIGKLETQLFWASYRTLMKNTDDPLNLALDISDHIPINAFVSYTDQSFNSLFN